MAHDKATTARLGDSLITLDPLDMRDRLASGAMRAADLAAACIEQVKRREADVQAWAWLDEQHVMAQAGRLDAQRKTGHPVGPLHGLPVALKDIIDTNGIPTENGTIIDKDRKSVV